MSGTTSDPFDSQTEQRLHFKSDWHRFNIKLRSFGRAAVDEAEFEQLVSEKDEVRCMEPAVRHCEFSLQLHHETLFVVICSSAHTDAKILCRCRAFLAQTQTLMMSPAPASKL